MSTLWQTVKRSWSERGRNDQGPDANKRAVARKIDVQDLNAWFGTNYVLKAIRMPIADKAVTAVIGPSGCGKSTLIRCLNRMHEVVPGASVAGRVLLDGRNIYDAGVDPVQVRAKVGMVFQRPNPFPTASIFDNVIAGLRLSRRRVPRSELEAIVERSLRQAALWDEVKDGLRKPGVSLSGGQQQRLCIARALAVQPEALLMDEPCSALDPIATAKIEELIHQLKEHYAIAIVTHNMQQAARVSTWTAFMLMGELVEFDETRRLFTSPSKQETEDYITGRFG